MIIVGSHALSCTLCHKDIRLQDHLGKAQCYACHGDGNVYAAFRGEQDCSICHGPESDPFDKVHKKHAGEAMMCAVCHTLMRPNVEGIQGFSLTSAPRINQPPTAQIQTSTSLVVGQTGFFSATQSHDPDGSIVSYQWDFGNGVKKTGMSVGYAYPAAGTYQVRLLVTDNDGETATATRSLTVTSLSTWRFRR